jgi:O-acetyl-ADP-ribose deacetylase (regulator of RNase III)
MILYNIKNVKSERPFTFHVLSEVLMKLIAERTFGEKTLRLVMGDITERNVDAIVNAANSHLQHGGGVAGAIVRKGGTIIQKESDAIGFVPVGKAAITTAGSLPSKFIIHAVGPRIGEGEEDNKLKSAVKNSLELASDKGLTSISMPAISSGIFGFPKDRCAKILVDTARDFLANKTSSSVKVIEFCIFDEITLGFFREEFDKLIPPK